MKTKLLLLILIYLFIGAIPLISQDVTGTRDKYTLLTMPYIQRPLNLYKGQIQVTGGYKFSMRSRSYDNDGEVISLKEKGSSSIIHKYFLNLRYGILNFIEIGAESYYSSQGIRSESVTYGAYMSQITVTSLKEYKGMGDLFIYGAIRLPFDYKKFDFSLTGGMFLPTASYESRTPSHSVDPFLFPDYYTINYHYNNRNGNGVMLWQVSASTKFSFSKFAAEASFSFSDPTKEGTNLRWDETLTVQSFTYVSTPYKYLPDRSISVNGSIHYQPVGWFNVYLGSGYTKKTKGWTEYWGLKYSNPDLSLVTLEPGYEIQVSPGLRLSQVAGFAVAGRNADAPFFMITTLSYNLFPFLK